MTTSVLLKVKDSKVKVVTESGIVMHKFSVSDDSVKGLLSQLKKESLEYDLESVDVLDVVYLD